MTVYLDTNFFIYLADPDSDYQNQCANLVKYCQKNNIQLATSVETIQEIIHYAKNTKQIEKGLETAQLTQEIIDFLLPVSADTIKIYLTQTKQYLSPESRDLLHLASCLENDIKYCISFDKDFLKFSRLKTLTPTQLINSNPD